MKCNLYDLANAASLHLGNGNGIWHQLRAGATGQITMHPADHQHWRVSLSAWTAKFYGDCCSPCKRCDVTTSLRLCAHTHHDPSAGGQWPTPKKTLTFLCHVVCTPLTVTLTTLRLWAMRCRSLHRLPAGAHCTLCDGVCVHGRRRHLVGERTHVRSPR